MKPPLKLLLISQVFYPDQVSTANLFTNLCVYLLKIGVSVEVWCAQPSYTEKKKQSRTSNYQGIEIHYLPSTHFHKRILLGRLFNYMTFMISVFVKLIGEKNKSPVITHTTPPSLGIVISWICLLRKRKFVYILLDIFPEGLIRLGRVSRNNLFIRLWERLHMGSLRRSHKIIVIGRDMEEWIMGIYPRGRSKLVYIPLWHDDHIISPIQYHENTLIQKCNLQDKFVVQYSGNMGLWNELEVIAHAVNRIYKDVFFLFIGDGMRARELFSNLNDVTHDAFIRLQFQPISQLNETLNACHVGLVSLKEGLQGMAVPSKIYGIMAAGKPIIAIVPDDSEIARVVHEENCGIVVAPNDADLLVLAILRLKNNKQLRTVMGENGRKAFELKYSTSNLSARYRLLLESMSD